MVTLLALVTLLSGPPPPVRILWFGATGGVSNHVGRNRAHLALAEQLGRAVGRLAPRADGPHAYAAEGHLLFADGGLPVTTLQRVVQHLDAAERQAVHPAWPVLLSPFEVVFEGPPGGRDTPALDLLLEAPDRLPGATRQTAALSRLVLEGETVWWLALPGAAAALPTDPAAWEVRFAWEGDVTVRGQPRRLFNVGRPVHEGARRQAALIAQQALAPDRTLILAAGDDLETRSFLDARLLDRQRPLSWAAYARLGVDGLAVGAAEAALGLPSLALEQQTHRVPVLAANLPSAPVPGHRLVKVGEAQVLLIGLTEPELDRGDRRNFGDSVPTDPVLAVRKARVTAEHELGHPPDLTVAFGHLSPATRRALTEAGAGIDLLLADFDDHGLVPARQVAQLTDEGQIFLARDRRPIPVVPAGRTRLGLAEVHFARTPRGHLQVNAVESQALPVPGDGPADAVTLRALTEVRQAAYAEGAQRLLPDLGRLIDADPGLRARFEADPLVSRTLRTAQVPGRLTATLWRTLVANTLRAHTGAEIAVLPALPFPWALTGPVSRLQAAANLDTPAELVVVRLSAAQLGALALKPGLGELVLTGLDVTDPLAPKVRGRALDPREFYTVLTTDGLRADGDLAGPLGGEVLAQPGPLRPLALALLGAAQDDAATLTAHMQADGGPAPRWVLDVRDLSVGASDYLNARPDGGTAAYAGVRETRVTTRDNLAFAGRGDVFLSRQAESVEWVNHLRAEFAEARYSDDVGGAAREETADGILAETELRIRALALGPARDVDPYFTVQYATEFTPTQRELPDGRLVDNPRKRRVDASLGLVWKRAWVQLLRLGAIVGQDFAEADNDPQVGAVVATQLGLDVAGLRWRLDAEARYFIPGVGIDTATELGAWLKARNSLDFPLFLGVGVGIYLDLFGYRGTSASTTDPGMSLVSGVALRFDRIFK
ncbi:MAG: hypothetical protein KC613_27180 [Myxococcales bacterium]|nr:hypothetical protein [Myxococcales bacterium]